MVLIAKWNNKPRVCNYKNLSRNTNITLNITLSNQTWKWKVKDTVDVTVLVEWFQIKVGKKWKTIVRHGGRIDHVLNYIGTCEHNIYNIIIILYVCMYV